MSGKKKPSPSPWDTQQPMSAYGPNQKGATFQYPKSPQPYNYSNAPSNSQAHKRPPGENKEHAYTNLGAYYQKPKKPKEPKKPKQRRG